MTRPRPDGFTLIEVLVVIGILSMLMTVLLRSLGSSAASADKKLDRISMVKQYHDLLLAHRDGKRLPPEGGHEFVYYPWVSKTVPRSPTQLEAMFHQGSHSPVLRELIDGDTRTFGKTYDEVDSEHTDYAGRAAEHYTRRMFGDHTEPLIATDNEHGNAYRDGSVLVLYGDGRVREFTPEDAGAADDPDYVIEVGPDSAIADLRKLKK